MKVTSSALAVALLGFTGRADAFTTSIHHSHQRFSVRPLPMSRSNDENDTMPKRQSKKERATTFGQVLLERSNTLQAAGFYDDDQQLEPVYAGFKTNIMLFLAAVGYKWYRSIFINKLAIWERQPQWNTVITSREDELKANLKAMTCKSCGSTLFIAKGRAWFQFPKDYECYCCGAKGQDNFIDTREDIIESSDDDYFDYEKPLDFVTRAERKKLMKEAGGDEQKAMEILAGRQNEEAAAAEETEAESTAPKKKKKKKKKKDSTTVATSNDADSTDAASSDVEKKEEPKKPKSSPDSDGLDELDMDAF